MTKIYAALEFGTSRIVMALGKLTKEGRLKVLCHAEIPSAGVRKSQIVDINQVSSSLKGVTRNIEEQTRKWEDTVSIHSVFLAVSGRHILQSQLYTGSVQVEKGVVREDEISQVCRETRKLTLGDDRELLDVFEQAYTVDTTGGIAAPEGMSGHLLSLDSYHVHAERSRIDDARTVLGTDHLNLQEPAYAVSCAADAVMSEAERKEGVLVLDLGGGSTGYAAYVDGYMVRTGVLGVGGDHVTNDIALAFKTSQSQAAWLKENESSAVLGAYDDQATRVCVPSSSPISETRTISRRALDTVVNARLCEMLAYVREQLEEQGLLQQMRAGVILTGGGAAQRDIATLVERELGLKVRIGNDLRVEGLEDVAFPAAYATIVGTLKYAVESDPDKKLPSSLKDIFGKFFG